MRVLVQRVSSSQVLVDGEIVGSINDGPVMLWLEKKSRICVQG